MVNRLREMNIPVASCVVYVAINSARGQYNRELRDILFASAPRTVLVREM